MKGTSYTYFTTDNAKQARELIGILRESKSEVPPELEQVAMFSGGGGGGRSMFSPVFLFRMPLTYVQVVTVPVVAVVGAEVRVVAVEVAEAATTVVDMAAVGAAAGVMADATGGELL